jgi:predicted RNase H-like HicB family nuclease
VKRDAIAFTAVYLRSSGGYVGFIEELPGVNSYGRSLDEARSMLGRLAQTVFEEERRGAQEALAGKEVIRENFILRGPWNATRHA